MLGVEIVEIDGGLVYRPGEEQLSVHGPGVPPAMVTRVPVASWKSDLCFERDAPIAGAVGHLRSHGVAVDAGPMTRGGRRGRGTSV